MKSPQTSYYFKVFGLRVKSELPCPELPEEKGNIDVTICYGKVPSNLCDTAAIVRDFQAMPGKLLFHAEGVARFLIEEGKKIVIEPSSALKNDDELRLFLLGSAFGAILLQRGILPLHASSIKVGNGCIAFSGKSGAGKSTIAAAFKQSGYSVLDDDVCAVSITKSGIPMAVSGYPQIKLSKDSLQMLDISKETESNFLPIDEKKAMPLDFELFKEPLPLKRLYLLNIFDKEHIELRSVSGMKKIEALGKYTYRKRFLQSLNLTIPHFHLIKAVADHTSVIEVFRPQKPFMLNELVAALENDFHSIKEASLLI